MKVKELKDVAIERYANIAYLSTGKIVKINEDTQECFVYFDCFEHFNNAMFNIAKTLNPNINDNTENFDFSLISKPYFKQIGKTNKLVTTNISSDTALNFTGEVYSPVIARDWRAEKDEDYLFLELKQYQITELSELPETIDLIITRHAATRDILKSLSPNAKIIESSVTADDLKDKVVAGVLPPALISECKSFLKFTVKDFDYNKDNDMSLIELTKRGYELTHIQVREVK